MISYYDETGRIYGTASGDDETMALTKQYATQPWVEGEWDGEAYYVDNGQVVERPACPAKLNGLKLTKLPAPCKIVINSTDYNVTEPTVDLEFDYPGVYKITVKAFPYLDGEFEIET
jgi:hypothetical protein